MRRQAPRAAALLLAALASVPLAAQGAGVPLPVETSPVSTSVGRETQAIAERFFRALAQGEVDDALAAGFPYLASGHAEDRQALASRMLADAARLGWPVAWERVQGRALGSFLVRQLWISQQEGGPLFWTFVFYRAPSGWRILDLSVDTRVPGPLA